MSETTVPKTAARDTTFTVLGPLRVRRGSQLVAVGRGSVTAILAVLLLSPNRLVSATTLAHRVWGGREPDDPRSTLYSGVSRLRKVLGPGLIETRDAGYLLRTDADHLDLLRFEGHLARVRGAEESGDAEAVLAALDEALALWSEPVLGGVEAPFVAEAAAGLTDRYLRVCERRASWGLKLGRHAEVVNELSPLVRAHPARAGLAEQLMLALYRSERRAEAVHVYTGLKAALGSGMDCAAGHRVGELHSRILRDDPGLVPPRPAAVEPPTQAPTPPPMRAQTPSPAPPRRVPRQLPGATARFIGRDEELAALDRLFAQQPPNEERNLVLAVDGTAGVGKTTLQYFRESILGKFGAWPGRMRPGAA